MNTRMQCFARHRLDFARHNIVRRIVLVKELGVCFLFHLKYRRTRFPIWMESNVAKRREWRIDSHQPIVPFWESVSKVSADVALQVCEFEQSLQSYACVFPSHISPVLPQMAFAAARMQFRFHRVSLRLVQTHSIIDCVGISCLCFATGSPRRFCLRFDLAATSQWRGGACSWHS